MKLSDGLSADRVKLALSATEKMAAIEELADIAQLSGRISDRAVFLDALMERENVQSTGIGHGIAILHARSSIVEGILVCLGLSQTGIAFESLDGAPVYLIFLVAAQEDMTAPYLSLLSRISRLISQSDLRQQIMKAQSPQEVIDLIRSRERI